MNIKHVLLGLSFTFVATLAQAQVKIGSNPGTIGSTSNLEVESSNGTKVIVDKTNGNLGAGVTDPGQSIDAAGTARLRNIPTNATNNLILTVDANGVVAKQNAQAGQLPIIIGSLPPDGPTIQANEPNYVNTGATITLPAKSKYVVNVTLNLPISAVFPAGTSVFMRTTFADFPASQNVSSDVTGGRLISGIVTPSTSYGLLTGSIIITNSTSSPKTYYYLAGQTSPIGNYSGLTINHVAAGNSVVGENLIYAVPVN